MAEAIICARSRWHNTEPCLNLDLMRGGDPGDLPRRPIGRSVVRR